jgi:hypothetical protein
MSVFSAVAVQRELPWQQNAIYRLEAAVEFVMRSVDS